MFPNSKLYHPAVAQIHKMLFIVNVLFLTHAHKVVITSGYGAGAHEERWGKKWSE